MDNKTEKDMLEWPDTEEALKVFEEYAEKMKKKEELIKNDEYMLWLESFMKEHEEFSNDDWDYCPEKISK